jgi:molybdopterin-guanine dinucleotide biosynthesis protein
MAIVVVGGHTRNIGKTSVVAALIAALPDRQWAAFKVTQFGHGICSAKGEPCDCETDAHTVAITEERDPTTGTDSARFLNAGAVHSFWVRTRQGQLAEAMPRIRKELSYATNAIIESNSIIRFLKPDLYLTVLDPAIADFKPSAQYFLDRADAVLWSGSGWTDKILSAPVWPAILLRIVRDKPQFFVEGPLYASSELTDFVARTVPIPHSSHLKA